MDTPPRGIHLRGKLSILQKLYPLQMDSNKMDDLPFYILCHIRMIGGWLWKPLCNGTQFTVGKIPAWYHKIIRPCLTLCIQNSQNSTARQGDVSIHLTLNIQLLLVWCLIESALLWMYESCCYCSHMTYM